MLSHLWCAGTHFALYARAKFYCELPAEPAQKNIAAFGMLKDKAGQ
jgi:hypothetical protein